MSRGFHFWHSQPLDRVTPLWLANHGPPFQAPVILKHDESVEGDIEGRVAGGGDAKTTASKRFTLTQTPQKPLNLILLAVTKQQRPT